MKTRAAAAVELTLSHVIIPYREVMICEGCGERVPARPWPDGWSQCGTSRKWARRTLWRGEWRVATNTASWCEREECREKLRDL